MPGDIPRNGSSPPARPRSSRLLIWILLAALIGPCAYLDAPVEVSRWYLAAAIEDQDAGHPELADQHFEQAFAWNPNDPELLVRRAFRQMQAGNYAVALADCNRANELVPESATVLTARSQVYQHMGEHAAAIADLKVIDRLSLSSGRPQRTQALNGLAYARTVANVELDEGLQEINEALAMAPANHAMLDTRGFLLYRLEKYDAAFADIDLALRGMERTYRELQKPIAPLERRLEYPEGWQNEIELAKQGVAVVRYHRALVLDKLGRNAEAKLDRARVKLLLGREADESLF
ncbi:MAG: hypothetical protein WD872_16695 [Pirellulaceae bacterium]